MVSVYMQITRLARAAVAAEDHFADRDQMEDAAEVLAQEYQVRGAALDILHPKTN